MHLLNTMMGILNIFHVKFNESYYPYKLEIKHGSQINSFFLCVTAVCSVKVIKRRGNIISLLKTTSDCVLILIHTHSLSHTHTHALTLSQPENV